MSAVTYCPIGGKQSYATRADAERVLKNIQRKPHRHAVGAGVYLCELGCGAWHLTAHLQSRERRLKLQARCKA